MKTYLITCDRCTAPASYSVGEIQLYLESHEQSNNLVLDGKILSPHESSKEGMVMVPADICSRCYNDLIHWFGIVNPRTGNHFEKPRKEI